MKIFLTPFFPASFYFTDIREIIFNLLIRLWKKKQWKNFNILNNFFIFLWDECSMVELWEIEEEIMESVHSSKIFDVISK